MTPPRTASPNRPGPIAFAVIRTALSAVLAVFTGLQWQQFAAWGGPVMTFFAVFASPIIVAAITARLVFLVTLLVNGVGSVSMLLHYFHDHKKATVNPVTDFWHWLNGPELPFHLFLLILPTVVALVVAYGFYKMRRDRDPTGRWY